MTTDTQTTAAAYLVAFRLRHGLTWQQLADICGVTIGGAQRWATGQQPGGDAVLRAQAWEMGQR